MLVKYEIEDEGKIEEEQLYIISFYLDDGRVLLTCSLGTSDFMVIKLSCIIKMKIYDDKNQLVYCYENPIKIDNERKLKIKWDSTRQSEDVFLMFIENLRKSGFKVEVIK